MASLVIPNQVVKMFICKICGKCYQHNKDLLRHKRSAHEGQSYACDKCTKEFKRKVDCINHEKNCGQSCVEYRSNPICLTAEQVQSPDNRQLGGLPWYHPSRCVTILTGTGSATILTGIGGAAILTGTGSGAILTGTGSAAILRRFGAGSKCAHYSTPLSSSARDGSSKKFDNFIIHVVGHLSAFYIICF
jgi:hypothetical protein